MLANPLKPSRRAVYIGRRRQAYRGANTKMYIKSIARLVGGYRDAIITKDIAFVNKYKAVI